MSLEKPTTIQSNNEATASIPQRVPTNWSQLLSLKADEMAKNGITENDLFITFQALSAPQVKFWDKILNGENAYKTTQSKILGTYSFLHPSTGLNERIQHRYGSDASAYTTAMAGFGEKAVSVLNSVKTWWSDSSQGAVYDIPVVWANTERREFNITLNLFAYNDLKKDLLDPIDFFRRNSYPRQSVQQTEKSVGGSIANRANFIDFPAVFRIWGGAFDTFSTNSRDKLNIYNLMSIVVDFNDSVKFMKQGVPMQAKITLQFQECLKIYRNMFDDNDRVYKVSETSAPNNPVRFTKNTQAPQNLADLTAPNSLLKKPTDYSNLIQVPTVIIPKEVARPSIIDQIKSSVIDLVHNTAAARFVNNIQQRAIQTAITAVLKTIQGSELYKKVDNIVNIDPQHQIELKQYLKTGIVYPENALHIAQDVTPLTKNVTVKEDSTHIPIDILPLLRKPRG